MKKNLNLESKNYAHGGNSNETIFSKICRRCHEFKKGDIIIVQWTGVQRFEWVNPVINRFVNLMPSCRPSNCGYGSSEVLISEDTFNEIMNNRTHIEYYKRVLEYENILKLLCESMGVDLFIFYMDRELFKINLESLNSDVRYFFNNELNYHTDYDDYFGLKSIQIINTFTNGEIYDNHYTLDGHIKMGELFLEHIIKNRKHG